MPDPDFVAVLEQELGHRQLVDVCAAAVAQIADGELLVLCVDDSVPPGDVVIGRHRQRIVAVARS